MTCVSARSQHRHFDAKQGCCSQARRVGLCANLVHKQLSSCYPPPRARAPQDVMSPDYDSYARHLHAKGGAGTAAQEYSRALRAALRIGR